MKLYVTYCIAWLLILVAVSCTKTVKEAAPAPETGNHRQIIGLEYNDGQILLPDALGDDIEFCYATKNYQGEPFLVCTTVGQIKQLAKNKKLSH